MANSSAIASDALRMALVLDLEGEAETLAKLQRINDFADAINTKSKTAADDIRMQRMEVEGKYDPEIQRNLEIEKAIKLTDRLNLSAETQLAILSEIEEKHRRIVADQHQQFSSSNMPGDDMVAAYRKMVDDQTRAEQDLVNARTRAAKETDRLREEDLSNYQRYVASVRSAKDLLDKGIIDNEGFSLRVKAARAEYDAIQKAEADKAKLAQDRVDAEAKAVADEKALWAARLTALDNALEEEARLQAEAANDATIEANQRRARASIEATERADREANATRQRAVNILHSLEDATQRYARTADELRAHLAAGDITNEEYAAGLANIQRRQQSMAGGMNNMGYIVGNTVTGLEDFVTVLSITGYGMDGFAAATRSASNNVAQAVRGIGTSAAMIAAPLVSIGMVLVGSAIPAIYRYITGAEDAAETTRKWKEELEGVVRVSRLMSDANDLAMNRAKTERDIQKMKDPEDILDKMKGNVDQIAALMNEIQGLEAELRAKANEVFQSDKSLISTESINDFNKLIDAYSVAADSIGMNGSDIEEVMRERLKKIQEKFVSDSMLLGSEAATANLEQAMVQFQGDIQNLVDELPSSLRTQVLDEADGYMNNFYNAWGSFVNDAAIIDEIQAVTEELLVISKEDTLEAVKKRQELETYKLELEQLYERRLKAIEEVKALEEEAARIASIEVQNQIDAELRSLQIQQQRASLLGEENEAERKLLDLALKRQEMGRSGAIPDDVLDDLFNQELEAIAADLDDKLNKMKFISMETGAASQVEAYASANRMMMAAAGKEPKTEEKEMIQLLKAIRDHLSGQRTLQVEFN